MAYNGNQLIKAPNETIEWNTESIQEYLRCAQDPIYFAEKYHKNNYGKYLKSLIDRI